jgi:serine/threonine protein kinase
MSPEQHAGEPLDGRTDVYSLAVTLYETLAGHPLRHGAYESLFSLNQTIPPQIDDLINACLEDKPRRLDSVKLFSTQLTGALQLPSKPIAEVLTHGKLHEVALALESLEPLGVMNLSAGQRDLLILKITDIATSNDPQLEFASERFLALMLTRGIYLPKEDYREIVVPAISWAFERYFGPRLGKLSVREAMEEAAFISRSEAHGVLTEEFIKFLQRTQLDDKEGWYLHGLREVITALMANPDSTISSPPLKEALRRVNKLQRGIDVAA